MFVLLYGFVINPGFKDAMVANQLAQMQAKGVPAQAYAMAEKMMNITLNPIFQAVAAIPFIVGFALLVSLIAAAVLKRAPSPETPPLPNPFLQG